MAEQPADSRNNNPFLITLFLSLIIGGGYLLYDSPLVSNRSPSSENTDPLTARLWEDPLNTYYAYLDISDNGLATETSQLYVEEISNVQNRLFGNGAEDSVAIIGVVLPEGRFTLTNEVRRRIRYSVISALTLNYEPQSAEKINLLNVERNAQSDQAVEAFIPYEIYSDWDIYPQQQPEEDGPAKKVLVLWIPSSYMQDPADEEDLYHDHLLSLFSRISENYTGQVVQSTVLGPDNSNEYFTLYNEILSGVESPLESEECPDESYRRYSQFVLKSEDSDSNCQQPPGNASTEETPLEIQYLSPRATVSDNWLRYAKGMNVGGEDDTNIAISSTLKRTILSDDALLESIYEEVSTTRFRIDADKARNEFNVALIHEIDTKYSYSISQLLDCNGLDKLAIIPEEHKTPCFDNVTSFGYLRGIDGVGPGITTNKEDNSSAQNANMLVQQGTLETAFGRAQFDYLNRLSQAISSMDFDVIGVIGTDVYDKLLILQALKEDNPNSLFFTTDLDELFLESSSQKWTRNLIIASAWSLNPTTAQIEDCQLNGKSRRFFPPNFRDSYQTAYFLSTCLALQKQGTTDYLTFRQEQGPSMVDVEPVLYEVGRSEFIPLTPPSDTDDSRLSGRKALTLLFGWTSLFIPVLSLTALSIALIRRYNLNPEQNHLQIRALKQCFTMSLLLIPGMALLIIVEAWLKGGEPTRPFQSTSNWPVTLLRLQIIFLGFWFLFYGRAKARDNSRNIQNLLDPDKHQNRSEKEDKVSFASAIKQQFSDLARHCRRYLKPKEFFHYLFHEQSDNDRAVNTTKKWINRIDNDNMISPAEKPVLEIWQQYSHIIKHICHSHRDQVLDTGPNSGDEAHWSYNLKQLFQIFLSPVAIAMTIITSSVFLYQEHLVRDSYWLANILFSNYFQYFVIFCSYSVIFFCVDMISSMRAFVHAMARYNVKWDNPHKYFNRYLFGNKKELQGPLSSMDIIARRADIIPPFIILPFILLLLMFWSKSFLFEGYHWNLSTGVIYAGVALYVLLCAYRLHAEIRFAHRILLKRIHTVEHQTDLWRDTEERDAAIALTLDCVSQMEKDVFVPWYKHSFFKSMIVPFTGSGGLLLLQAFMN